MNLCSLAYESYTNPDMSVQMMTLPETVCRMRKCTGLEIDPGKYCSRVVMPVAENWGSSPEMDKRAASAVN